MYLILLVNGLILHSMVREFYLSKYIRVIIILTIITLFYLGILFFSAGYMEMSFVRLVVLCTESALISALLLLLVLTKEEKGKIKMIISNRISRYKK